MVEAIFTKINLSTILAHIFQNLVQACFTKMLKTYSFNLHQSLLKFKNDDFTIAFSVCESFYTK